MTRGYFDRSPFDAQITRHVTRPLINLLFPEGYRNKKKVVVVLTSNE